jgi:DNA-binding protein HU-beta
MNRRELVRAVAAQVGEDPKQVDAIVSGVTDVVTAVVAKGEPVSIQGFAKFTKVHRPARMARNPQTGEQVRVKAKTVAKATAMKAFRDTVMAPNSAPRLGRGVWPTDPELLSRQAQERKEASRNVRTGGTGGGRGPAKKASAKKASAKKASAKRTTAKKSAAKRTTKKATAKRPSSRRR